MHSHPSLVCSIFLFVFFQLSFQPHLVPGFLPGHKSPTGRKEQKERPRKLGVDDVALVCHTSAALQTEVDLSRLRKHTLRKQGGTGSKNTHELFYLHLAQGNAAPCVLSPQLLLLYSDVVIRILAPSDSSNSCLPQLRTPAL